jgi:hypothetical protein
MTIGRLPRGHGGRRYEVGIGLLLAFGSLRSAHADEKIDCVQAADAAQAARKVGHLMAARERLLVCAQESCPAAVRRFCEPWLEEVEASLPTVVFRVADALGRDLTDVRVFVDGSRVTSQLDGRPLTVDPGAHLFRFESRDGGSIEQQVLIVESQKNRILAETLSPLGAPAPPVLREGPHVPTATWALGAVAAAGLVSFAALTVAGSSTYSTCVDGPCSSSARSSLDPIRALAWTSLGVSVAAAGGSTWIYLASPPSSASKIGMLSIRGAPSGAIATWGGSF